MRDEEIKITNSLAKYVPEGIDTAKRYHWTSRLKGYLRALNESLSNLLLRRDFKRARLGYTRIYDYKRRKILEAKEDMRYRFNNSLD